MKKNDKPDNVIAKTLFSKLLPTWTEVINLTLWISAIMFLACLAALLKG